MPLWLFGSSMTLYSSRTILTFLIMGIAEGDCTNTSAATSKRPLHIQTHLARRVSIGSCRFCRNRYSASELRHRSERISQLSVGLSRIRSCTCPDFRYACIPIARIQIHLRSRRVYRTVRGPDERISDSQSQIPGVPRHFRSGFGSVTSEGGERTMTFVGVA